MKDILKDLYINHFIEAHEPSPEYWEARRLEAALQNQLMAGLTREESDRLTGRQADLELVSNLEWFREGFRLGVLLMLELQ